MAGAELRLIVTLAGSVENKARRTPLKSSAPRTVSKSPGAMCQSHFIGSAEACCVRKGASHPDAHGVTSRVAVPAFLISHMSIEPGDLGLFAKSMTVGLWA